MGEIHSKRRAHAFLKLWLATEEEGTGSEAIRDSHQKGSIAHVSIPTQYNRGRRKRVRWADQNNQPLQAKTYRKCDAVFFFLSTVAF